jgi:hypothetical protein
MILASSRFGGFGVYAPKSATIEFLHEVRRSPASRFGCKPGTTNLLDTVGESDAGFVISCHSRKSISNQREGLL